MVYSPYLPHRYIQQITNGPIPAYLYPLNHPTISFLTSERSRASLLSKMGGYALVGQTTGILCESEYSEWGSWKYAVDARLPRAVPEAQAGFRDLRRDAAVLGRAASVL
jgi:hypothetical protein